VADRVAGLGKKVGKGYYFLELSREFFLRFELFDGDFKRHFVFVLVDFWVFTEGVLEVEADWGSRPELEGPLDQQLPGTVGQLPGLVEDGDFDPETERGTRIRLVVVDYLNANVVIAREVTSVVGGFARADVAEARRLDASVGRGEAQELRWLGCEGR